ncbi:phycobilisome protein [Thermoleptolyngbya sichuanensis A183]|uniref:Phycobilisome protein n=1 Tax=Thermoleptolyngbya sichuanensis A183 TaxID=2737172 RepID=A0A6M8BIC9_9CYAN|nr:MULTISPECIES: phycobilisome protein [Thermoleptolyngbya]QKD82205.1 phycobilisome protein [Thermoleptolyngbya sichuanensis A183]
MLSQMKRLSLETEGQYATDADLQFLRDYAKSYGLRVETYRRIQNAEALLVSQVQQYMMSKDPTLFQNGDNDLTTKWKRDTVRVLRYSAVAMLLNDPETLQERFLLWFQTIMRAFGAQQSCNATYEAMQHVVQQHLTPVQASLFCPILEINRHLLGGSNA